MPARPIGVVLFAHGSGSGRLSPRNAYVANVLNERHIATLLVDLLTEEEDAVYATRFDIALLTERLTAVAAWLRKMEDIAHVPLGLFGASTGAASALMLAAKKDAEIAIVISRGGRVDMAEEVLGDIHCPVLFLVGERDDEVRALNEQAFEKLHTEKTLVIIPDATHLFEEPGTIEAVATHAADWCVQHF